MVETMRPDTPRTPRLGYGRIGEAVLALVRVERKYRNDGRAETRAHRERTETGPSDSRPESQGNHQRLRGT
jgi:hypothetical protein